MKHLFFTALAFMLTAFVFAGHADAQDKGHIELTTVAEIEKVVVNETGEKETMLVPAAKVLPGDEVIYRITYRNISDKPVENIVITDPVPEHMFYKGGSASGEGMEITFSIDGGKTYDTPDKLIKTLDDGSKVMAEASEYTNISWAMKRDLQPGEKGEVSFWAELE